MSWCAIVYTSAGHYFGVPAITATSVDEAYAAIAQGLQTHRPVIVEAMVDPSEYEELILRPHKMGAATKNPHAS